MLLQELRQCPNFRMVASLHKYMQRVLLYLRRAQKTNFSIIFSSVINTLAYRVTILKQKICKKSFFYPQICGKIKNSCKSALALKRSNLQCCKYCNHRSKGGVLC